MDIDDDICQLPSDLHELKRPALIQLCKRWNIKAVGKVRAS